MILKNKVYDKSSLLLNVLSVTSYHSINKICIVSNKTVTTTLERKLSNILMETRRWKSNKAGFLSL